MMQTKYSLVVAAVLGSLTMTGLASAQEAEAGTGANGEIATAMHQPRGAIQPTDPEQPLAPGHADGLMIQARVQAQTNLLSIGGSGFLIGYQGPSFALGLGLGFTRLGLHSGNDSGSGTLFQVAPTAIIDVWHSRDGRARANILGSVGYARASLSVTAESESCTGSATGADMCTTSTSTSTASASLIPITVGFGGDYFLSRNFALGAELGLQAMILAGANSSSGSSTKEIDAGGDLEMAYGALRATFVIGD